VIAFELAWPARATLRVLDIEGRLVRRLLDEPRAAGSHTATWDGRTEPGAPAPSGIYFYELRAGEFAASRKMSVVR
jgi:flagellar hook assembly protein FlgD